MGQEVIVPDWAQNRQMSQAFAALNPADDNLAEGIGQSYGVIGYKGKVFSLRYRGERKNIIRPDDGTPAAYLDVIILGQAKQKSKSYYKDYKEGDMSPPLCSSIDGVVPDSDVRERQHANCALCPKNEWKVNPQTGKKGRDCTDYKRLAVLILPTQTKAIMGGEPLLEPVFLRVPPASLNSLANMGESMGNQGYHYSSYITRITFDPNAAHPQMMFRPLQGLTDAEAPVILKLREDPTVGRITGAELAGIGMRAVEQGLAAPGTNVTGLGATATQPTSQLAQTSNVVPLQPASPNPPQPAQPSSAVAQQTGLGLGTISVVQPATKSQSSLATSNGATGLVDTGFGGANVASPSVQPSLQPAAQTVADAGAPEDSDAALDARLAALIGSKK